MVPADEWCDAEQTREAGRALREVVDHAAHATVTIPSERPSIGQFLAARNVGRMPELVPMGHARMVVNPFAFYRGSAGLMAHDLAHDPVTGIHGQICGDAHAANFGLYGTRDARIVMDINDFDETAVGPWEWDLKRLATSVVLAGRAGADVGDKAGRKATRDAARAYRKGWADLAGMPFVDAWAALGDEGAMARARADELFDDFRREAGAAARNTSERVARRIAHRHAEHGWHFLAEPPVLNEVDEDTKRAVFEALPEYYGTLHRSVRPLAIRYRPRDVAVRVVGTGSVGMRSYVILLQGNADEALVLQAKQAGPSALAPYLPAAVEPHQGERIVLGARLVQAETDHLFGWTTIAGTDYIVRQFRNRKGTIDPTLLTRDHLDDYARLAGSLLARAHSRSIDPRLLAGYLDHGAEFDDAITEFAIGYARQVERDHAEMVDLVAAGVLAATATPDG